MVTFTGPSDIPYNDWTVVTLKPELMFIDECLIAWLNANVDGRWYFHSITDKDTIELKFLYDEDAVKVKLFWG